MMFVRCAMSAVLALPILCLAGWAPSYTSVSEVSARYSLEESAAIYDAENETIWFIGGYSHSELLSLYSVRNDEFLSQNSNGLSMSVTSGPVHYAEMYNELWMLYQYSNVFVKFNPNTRQLTKTSISLPHSVMNSESNQACLCSYSPFLIVVGGSSDGTSDRIQVFDSWRGVWNTDMLKLPWPLRKVGCIVSDDHLIVFGGRDQNGDKRKEIISFDLFAAFKSNNTNYKVLDETLLLPQDNTRAVQDEAHIYVLGGTTEHSDGVAEVQVMSKKHMKFIKKSQGTLSWPTRDGAVVYAQDRLYVFGGSGVGNRVQYINLGPTYKSGTQNAASNSDKFPVGYIVLGALLLVAGIAVVLVWFSCRKKKYAMLQESLTNDAAF